MKYKKKIDTPMKHIIWRKNYISSVSCGNSWFFFQINCLVTELVYVKYSYEISYQYESPEGAWGLKKRQKYTLISNNTILLLRFWIHSKVVIRSFQLINLFSRIATSLYNTDFIRQSSTDSVRYIKTLIYRSNRFASWVTVETSFK